MGESKGIKKIKPYYLCITLNLIVINVNVQLSQTENATSPSQRRTNCFCLLVLQQSVGILETTHWRLLQTGIPINNPFTWLIRHSALLTLRVSDGQTYLVAQYESEQRESKIEALHNDNRWSHCSHTKWERLTDFIREEDFPSLSKRLKSKNYHFWTLVAHQNYNTIPS